MKWTVMSTASVESIAYRATCPFEGDHSSIWWYRSADDDSIRAESLG
jgi:hypothetical protein